MSGWTVLSVFVGLPLSLWAYKCLMMYVFQRKIIYMGYIPMGGRTEALKDVALPSNVHAEQITVPSGGRSFLSGVLVWHKSRGTALPAPTTIVVYFQGNAGNTLQRLPKFASLLDAAPSAVVLAVAPRSFWSSTGGRPTQAALTSDYLRALAYAAERFPHARVIVYGHSLGASIATCVLAADPAPQVHCVVLENPFASIPDMVRALYPERWLPYHYMGSLVWDTWDAVGAASSPKPESALARVIQTRRMLVLVSEKDELVPPPMGHAIAEKAGDGARVVSVRGALHETGWTRKQWQDEMARCVREVEQL
ncbi:alpha/beta-hydrolase [Peniophora sp. CONT]|nr:alpha/beta-hydrolase [Peniophora sp. CONT]